MKLDNSSVGLIGSNLLFILIILFFYLEVAEIILASIFQSFILVFFVVSRVMLIKQKRLKIERTSDVPMSSPDFGKQIMESVLKIVFVLTNLISAAVFHLFYLIFFIFVFFEPKENLNPITGEKISAWIGTLDLSIVLIAIFMFLLSELWRFFLLVKSQKIPKFKNLHKSMFIAVLPTHIFMMFSFIFILGFGLPKLALIFFILLKTVAELKLAELQI